MKNILKRFFIAFFVAVLVCMPFASFSTEVVVDNTAVEVSASDNEHEGASWVTEANREKFVGSITDDLNSYKNGFVKTYESAHVPIEAKLGMALMNGLSHVSNILDRSLVRFVKVFLVLAFLFWATLNVYNMIRKPEKDTIEFIKDIITKGVILGFWLLLLDGGLQQLFGWIMGPIVSLGSYISGVILDGVASVGGMHLPDNCAAIQQYAVENASEYLITDAKFAGQILCAPTRLSGFYYSVMIYGFSLMLTGVGVSALTFFAGSALVFTFTYAAFKFLFVAFGVIADLFLVVIMLPFTAIAENTQKTKYDGIAGQIYNNFLGLFKPVSLDAQITKYIKAAIYFVALSIVVAVGGSFIASVVSYNSNTHLFTLTNHNVIELILVGALVAYIASHSDDIAAKIGAKLDDIENSVSFRSQLQKDVKHFTDTSKKKIETLYKAWKSRKK